MPPVQWGVWSTHEIRSPFLLVIVAGDEAEWVDGLIIGDLIVDGHDVHGPLQWRQRRARQGECSRAGRGDRARASRASARGGRPKPESTHISLRGRIREAPLLDLRSRGAPDAFVVRRTVATLDAPASAPPRPAAAKRTTRVRRRCDSNNIQ